MQLKFYFLTIAIASYCFSANAMRNTIAKSVQLLSSGNMRKISRISSVRGKGFGNQFAMFSIYKKRGQNKKKFEENLSYELLHAIGLANSIEDTSHIKNVIKKDQLDINKLIPIIGNGYIKPIETVLSQCRVFPERKKAAKILIQHPEIDFFTPQKEDRYSLMEKIMKEKDVFSFELATKHPKFDVQKAFKSLHLCDLHPKIVAYFVKRIDEISEDTILQIPSDGSGKILKISFYLKKIGSKLD